MERQKVKNEMYRSLNSGVNDDFTYVNGPIALNKGKILTGYEASGHMGVTRFTLVCPTMSELRDMWQAFQVIHSNMPDLNEEMVHEVCLGLRSES